MLQDIQTVVAARCTCDAGTAAPADVRDMPLPRLAGARLLGGATSSMTDAGSTCTHNGKDQRDVLAKLMIPK